MNMTSVRGGWSVALAVLLAIGASTRGLAQEAGATGDAKARALVRQMTDFLGQQGQFSAKTANTVEVVLTSGQKLQFDSVADVAVMRPDKLRAIRTGDLEQQELVYDGKALTVFTQAGGVPYYATVAAPPTLGEALDFARDSLDVTAPAGDLLYANAYDILMEDVVSGMVVGSSVVGGVRCHHLAFRGSQTDWQIWIEDGAKPLPRKMVITSKWIVGAPQYTVTTSDWNLAPHLGADRFRFVPPKGATKIDFIASGAAKAPAGQRAGEGRK